MWDSLLVHTYGLANHPSRCQSCTVYQRVFSATVIAVDHAIEQTVNRDSKTPGGIIRMSTNVSATQRWLLTAHDCVAMTRHCHDLAGLVRDKSTAHKEVMPNHLKRDEDDVQSLTRTLTSWLNPFTSTEETICNISCGILATPDIKVHLLTAYGKGQEACMKFITSQLVNQTTSFYDRLPKMKLHTLKSMTMKKKVKTMNGIIQLRADKKLFAQLAVIAQTRSMDTCHIMSFPLGPVPWSLASPDGSLIKTTKAKLLHLLEEDVQPLADPLLLVGFLIVWQYFKPCKVTRQHLLT